MSHLYSKTWHQIQGRTISLEVCTKKQRVTVEDCQVKSRTRVPWAALFLRVRRTKGFSGKEREGTNLNPRDPRVQLCLVNYCELSELSNQIISNHAKSCQIYVMCIFCWSFGAPAIFFGWFRSAVRPFTRRSSRVQPYRRAWCWPRSGKIWEGLHPIGKWWEENHIWAAFCWQDHANIPWNFFWKIERDQAQNISFRMQQCPKSQQNLFAQAPASLHKLISKAPLWSCNGGARVSGFAQAGIIFKVFLNQGKIP